MENYVRTHELNNKCDYVVVLVEGLGNREVNNRLIEMPNCPLVNFFAYPVN